MQLKFSCHLLDQFQWQGNVLKGFHVVEGPHLLMVLQRFADFFHVMFITLIYSKFWTKSFTTVKFIEPWTSTYITVNLFLIF